MKTVTNHSAQAVAPHWALFHVSYVIFRFLAARIGGAMEAKSTKFPESLQEEVKLAAFLMYSGGPICQAVGTQLRKARQSRASAMLAGLSVQRLGTTWDSLQKRKR